MGMKAARRAITETLLKLAREDKTIFALATDSSGSVTLNDFVRELPGQFVECGIAEQDAVGIAAGLAASGLKPFVCGPASFYACLLYTSHSGGLLYPERRAHGRRRKAAHGLRTHQR